jgi:hypothetical protein
VRKPDRELTCEDWLKGSGRNLREAVAQNEALQFDLRRAVNVVLRIAKAKDLWQSH